MGIINTARVNFQPLGLWYRIRAVSYTHLFREDSRGVGIADMAYALRNGRRPRAHMDLGFHAFEVMHGIWRSGDTGKIYELTSHCERPKPLRSLGLSGTAEEFTLDD